MQRQFQLYWHIIINMVNKAHILCLFAYIVKIIMLDERNRNT